MRRQELELDGKSLRAWHRELRQDMPTVYDAIADRAFWHGVGITVAVLGGLWLIAGVR